MNSIDAHLQQMKALRDSAGARSVLAYLNNLEPHRFSAMYRFAGPQLKSVCFYDREHPEVGTCPELPIAASYCMFVKRSGHFFSTVDSVADERVDDHPKRLTIRSYIGVPLIDISGDMFGTVCHFDTSPHDLGEESIELMEALGSILDPSRHGLGVALGVDGDEP